MSDSATVRARKATIRAEALAARRRLEPARLAEAATRVRAALLDHLPELLRSHAGSGEPPVAASYVPVGAEPGGPDLPDVLHRALPPGCRLLLPVLRDDLDLDWAAHDHELRPTRRGLSEPTGPRLGPQAIAEATLLVVPALAVDRHGVRLGRGGGSYDRALARVPSGATVVALLHDGELRQEPLPAEPHDRPVAAVVTPGSGLEWINRSRPGGEAGHAPVGAHAGAGAGRPNVGWTAGRLMAHH